MWCSVGSLDSACYRMVSRVKSVKSALAQYLLCCVVTLGLEQQELKIECTTASYCESTQLICEMLINCFLVTA